MSTIQLSSGRYYDLLNPGPLTVHEVARALSRICRFGGHCSRFYSVAQHSVLVSRACGPGYEREGLLHDAAEAVLGDVPTPMKRLYREHDMQGRGTSVFACVHDVVEQTVASGFNLPWPMSETVRVADLRALATERQQMMPPEEGDDWACLVGVEPLGVKIYPLDPMAAEQLFLQRYREVMR